VNTRPDGSFFDLSVSLYLRDLSALVQIRAGSLILQLDIKALVTTNDILTRPKERVHMARRTYNEMLNDPAKDSTIVDLTRTGSPEAVARYGETMLVASPLEYNEMMRNVPYGMIITTAEMKRHLASKHGTSCVCPLTCGIFVNICANAAVERNDKTFPYWRTVKAKGELCEKFPDGLEGHKALLETEGHKIVKKGKRYFVEDLNEVCIEL